MKWKVFAFIICVCLMIMPFVQAEPGYGTWVFTDASKFRLTIRSLSDGVSFSNSSLSWNTTAEYFEFYLNATSSSTQTARFEFTVPDCYMGLSVWEWNGMAWVLRDGASGWALSVPYSWDDTTTPPYDWGSSGLGSGSGNGGSAKRVQLAVPLTANVQKQLKVRVYYATSPAMGFDGVNDYVEVPDSNSLDLAGEFTLVAWVRLNAYPTGVSPQYWAEIINKGANGSTYYNNYILKVRSNGVFDGWVGNPPTDTYVLSITRLSLNTWYHTAFVYVPSTRMTLYANGAFNSEKTSGVPASAYTNNGPLEIGRWVNNLNEFPGRIGEIRIYGRALNADEISALYNRQEVNSSELRFLVNASSFSSNPTNTTVVDFSGSGNHGTAYGNVQYKVYTGTGFKVTYVGEVPREVLVNGLINGYGTLLGKKVDAALATIENGNYANAFEVLHAYNYTLKLIANEKAFAWYNITDSDALVVVPNASGRWAMAIDHDQKLIQVYFASPVSAINATDVFSIPNAAEWLRGAWGVGVYGVLLLLPASVYLRSKNAGATALVLLAISAAGIALDPGIAPLAVLAMVGATALLLYRVLYKPQ